MALPKNINLNTDKRNPLVYEGLTLRQSEQNLVMQATLLNPDKSPYDLSGGKTITFNEHKQNDKFVVDTNVKIVDASHGNISYMLNKQCFAASGEGWFEIISKDGQVVDSTQIFRMNVLDAANANVANTNYISKLDQLRDQMQSMIDSADGQLKTELQNAQNQLISNVNSIKKTYNDLTIGFQNQFKQAQDSRAKSGTDAINTFNSNGNKAVSDFNSKSQGAINTFNSNGNKAISDFKSKGDQQVSANISNWGQQWNEVYNQFATKIEQDQTSYETLMAQLQKELADDTANEKQLSKTLSDLVNKVNATSKDIDNLKTTFNSTVFAKASDVKVAEVTDWPSNLTSLNDSPEGRFNFRNLSDAQFNAIKDKPPEGDKYGQLLTYKLQDDGWQIWTMTSNLTCFYFRGKNGGWQKISQSTTTYTNADIDARGRGTVVTAYDVANKNPTKVQANYRDKWIVDQAALANLADAINGKASKSDVTNAINGHHDVSTIEDNSVNLSTLTKSGIYVCRNSGNTGAPTFFNDKRGTLVVYNFDDNAKTQLWFPVETEGRSFDFAIRYWEGNTAPAWKKIINSDDVQSLINAHQPDLSGINNNISNLQGQYNSLKTQVTNLQNKEYIHVVNNLTDAQNYSKAHPEILVIVKGS